MATATVTPSRFALVRRFFDELKWWHWVLTTLIGGFIAIYSQFPSLSIAPQTKVGRDPLIAQFAFTNTGRIPAVNVAIQCQFPKPLTVEGDRVKGVEFTGVSPVITLVPKIPAQGTATRGCGISIPSSVPKGIVEVVATYYMPLWPRQMRSVARYGFAFDSAAGGYVYVPQDDE